ncbi:hypothetical protein AMTR_s00019p00245520 [Amborella trichopoda]|uniref:Uncharacterized protein n=1 Tax=Amborella trichopoda TaxID=13333 RepID=W1PIF5_AMBTC|nr:hypothetical protein AMTR_s00019p00245520 [Amborella trichopoda]
MYTHCRSAVAPEALLPERAYQLPERWYKLPDRCIPTARALWLQKPNYRSVENIPPEPNRNCLLSERLRFQKLYYRSEKRLLSERAFILPDCTCLLSERLWLQKFNYWSEKRLLPERAFILLDHTCLLPERLWLQKL